MIIYPPGMAAANHHHVGAEHFMYVLRGRGTGCRPECGWNSVWRDLQ
jgi:quercetin dioxygenase-like cupin family protein